MGPKLCSGELSYETFTTLYMQIYQGFLLGWTGHVTILTHFGLVMPYGRHRLHRLRWWLVVWRHRAIIWNNIHWSPVRSFGIHLRAISQKFSRPHPRYEFSNYWFKITPAFPKNKWGKAVFCHLRTWLFVDCILPQPQKNNEYKLSTMQSAHSYILLCFASLNSLNRCQWYIYQHSLDLQSRIVLVPEKQP